MKRNQMREPRSLGYSPEGDLSFSQTLLDSSRHPPSRKGLASNRWGAEIQSYWPRDITACYSLLSGTG